MNEDFLKQKICKEELIKILECKKKFLVENSLKNNFRNYTNFLSVSIQEELQRCNKLIRQSRSFSLLCHSQIEEALKFLLSCSEKSSDNHQLVSICPRETLEQCEKMYSGIVSNYSELLFLPESEESLEQHSELEQELSSLREALALAWRAKIRQSLCVAKLEAQAAYMKSQHRVPNFVMYQLKTHLDILRTHRFPVYPLWTTFRPQTPQVDDALH